MNANNEWTIILVGAGHAHMHVAARAPLFREKGLRLILVDPDQFWYSGLATGMLAATYAPQEDRIDPAPLIEAGGGTFIRDRVVGIQPSAAMVTLASGEHLRYDLLSLNVGSRVDRTRLPGDDAGRLWPVKPVTNLWALRQHLEGNLFRDSGPHRLAVVGGGPTGCEVAACAQGLAERYQAREAIEITLITANHRLLPAAPARAAQRLRRGLEHRGIRVVTDTRISHLEQGVPAATNGRRFECDSVVQATGLVAPELICNTALARDADGNLLVDGSLRSVADAKVFAAGDCAHLAGHELPRLGVFGVRQAPLLTHNLLATAGGQPLREYHPQRRWLSILNLGDGRGLALRGSLYWHGYTAMLIKDYIDRRFMQSYRAIAEPDR